MSHAAVTFRFPLALATTFYKSVYPIAYITCIYGMFTVAVGTLVAYGYLLGIPDVDLLHIMALPSWNYIVGLYASMVTPILLFCVYIFFCGPDRAASSVTLVIFSGLFAPFNRLW